MRAQVLCKRDSPKGGMLDGAVGFVGMLYSKMELPDCGIDAG